MKYYQFHLGDYAQHTGHLDPIEDIAYRRMLDLYYREQAPLSLDVQRIAKLIRMPDHASTVRDILNEFFTESPEGYRNARADREIYAYKRMADGGAKGAAKRWLKGGDSPPMPTPCQPHPNPNANHEPITTNHEPITKVEKPRASRSATPSRPDDVSEQVWADWCQLRKAKRATVTATVIAEARGEAAKAGLTLERFFAVWCARGSQGLQADWLKPNELAPQQTRGLPGSFNKQEALEARNAAAGDEWLRQQGIEA